MEKRRFTVGIVGIYLFRVGLLSGMIFDRIRFDESRTVLLKELEGTSLGYTSKGGSSHDTFSNGIQEVWVRLPSSVGPSGLFLILNVVFFEGEL